ncbi:MAG: molybdenum cofactor guanylyltransferase [Agarilytica sp.]
MSDTIIDIPAVILAGGSGTRMGGRDKCLLPLGNSTVLEVILKTLRAQTKDVYLNVNGDKRRFDTYDLPIIQDTVSPPIGPLGGLLSVCEYVFAQHPESKWLLTVAGDCPFLPKDLIKKLYTRVEPRIGAAPHVVYCHSQGRDHFVVALWSRAAAPQLREFLESGQRSVGRFIDTLPHASVNFDSSSIDPFFNINTDEQWSTAKAVVQNTDNLHP